MSSFFQFITRCVVCCFTVALFFQQIAYVHAHDLDARVDTILDTQGLPPSNTPITHLLSVGKKASITTFVPYRSHDFLLPNNKKVSLTFTKLKGTETLLEVTLETVSVHGKSEQAYTFSGVGFVDGEFSYTLTLPNPYGTKAKVLWRKNATDTFKPVSNVSFDVVAQTVSFALDHFTTFVVTDPSAGPLTETGCILLGGTSGTCFTSLQAAIDAATGVDTIYVYSGVYVEDITVANTPYTPLRIIGIGGPITCIGDWTINAHQITIQNMGTISGNVTIQGNQNLIDRTQIGGNVFVQGNANTLRALTGIVGSVLVTGNATTIQQTTIGGDLLVVGDNTTLQTIPRVYGGLYITGNSTMITSVSRVDNAVSIEGNNATITALRYVGARISISGNNNTYTTTATPSTVWQGGLFLEGNDNTITTDQPLTSNGSITIQGARNTLTFQNVANIFGSIEIAGTQNTISHTASASVGGNISLVGFGNVYTNANATHVVGFGIVSGSSSRLRGVNFASQSQLFGFTGALITYGDDLNLSFVSITNPGYNGIVHLSGARLTVSYIQIANQREQGMLLMSDGTFSAQHVALIGNARGLVYDCIDTCTVNLSYLSVTGNVQGLVFTGNGSQVNGSISRSVFWQNTDGIIFGQATGTLRVASNEFVGNTGYAIVSATSIVDANNNRWGHASGPGPSGSGDVISGNVQAIVFPTVVENGRGFGIGYNASVKSWTLPAINTFAIETSYPRGSYIYVNGLLPFTLIVTGYDQNNTVCTAYLNGLQVGGPVPLLHQTTCVFSGLVWTGAGGATLSVQMIDNFLVSNISPNAPMRNRIVFDRLPPLMQNGLQIQYRRTPTTLVTAPTVGSLRLTNGQPRITATDANFSSLAATAPLRWCTYFLRQSSSIIDQQTVPPVNDNTCSITLNLQEGTYDLAWSGMDWVYHAGIVGPRQTFTVDTTPPSITLMPQATGTREKPVITGIVTVTVTDKYGVASVGYTFVSRTTDCSSLADALFTIPFTGTSGTIVITSEQYNKKLCVRAIDLVGNTQTAELAPIYVDRTPPTGNITAQITSSREPIIVGTVDDNFGVDLLYPSLFSLQVSGGLLGTRTFPLTTLVSGFWTVQTTLLDRGQYDLRLLMQDPAGNTSSVFLPRGLIIDTDAILTLLGPAVGYYNTGMITFQASCQLNPIEDKGALCTEATFHRDPIGYGRTGAKSLFYTTSTGLFETTALLQEGMYHVRVEGYDSLRNYGSTKELPHTIVVDQTPPMVSVSGIGTYYQTGFTITVTVTEPYFASYAYGFTNATGICDETITYTPLTSWITSGDKTILSFDITDPALHEQYLCSRASDKAGNVTYHKASRPLLFDQEAPIFSFLTGDATSYCATKTVTYTVSGMDNTTGVRYSYATVSGGFISGLVWTQANPFRFSLPTPTATVYIRDQAGNIASQSISVVVPPCPQAPVYYGGGGGGGSVVYITQIVTGSTQTQTVYKGLTDIITKYEQARSTCASVFPAFQQITFTDIPVNSPAYDLLSKCAVRGVGNDGTKTRVPFGPNLPLTRAEVLKILVNATRIILGLQTLLDTDKAYFAPLPQTDISVSDRYFVYAAQAEKWGWLGVWGKETQTGVVFSLNQIATVEDIVRMVGQAQRHLHITKQPFPRKQTTGVVQRGAFASYVVDAFNIQGDYFFTSTRSNNLALLKTIATKAEKMDPETQKTFLTILYKKFLSVPPLVAQKARLDMRSILKVLGELLVSVGAEVPKK